MNVRCKPTSFFNILTLAWPVSVQSKGFVQIKKEKSKKQIWQDLQVEQMRNRLLTTV